MFLRFLVSSSFAIAISFFFFSFYDITKLIVASSCLLVVVINYVPKKLKLLENMSYFGTDFDPPHTDIADAGVKSEHANCSYGISSIQGKRDTMEDFYEAQFTVVDDTTLGLFGVFDGHGGPGVADYLQKNLFKSLIMHPKFTTDIRSAIVETYQLIDSEYLRVEKGKYKDAGSTATAAILVGDRLLVANVGDSRAVISRAGKAIPLSIDHKPNRKDERQRIENAGGAVIWAGTWRVGGILAVSRAFGDRLLKRFVVAIPEFQEEVVDDNHEFLIIASDGLWDVITNQNAVSLIRSIPDAQDAAKKLTEEALRKGSTDNITCIVLRFHKKPKKPS